MNISAIDFSEYEPVPDPAPTNATPREFVLWATGKDIAELKDILTGRDLTWEELERADATQFVTRLVQLSTSPVRFRKKTQ